MQSKFPSEYFVFLKSVGVIRRVTAMSQFPRALQCYPGSGCGRSGGPAGFLGFLNATPTPPPFWFGNFGYLWGWRWPRVGESLGSPPRCLPAWSLPGGAQRKPGSLEKQLTPSSHPHPNAAPPQLSRDPVRVASSSLRSLPSSLILHFWTWLWMIFLGISKSNSETIRNPSANPWPSFPSDALAVVPGRRGRVWRGRPALPGADSASESSLQEHSRPRVSSPPRVPELRQRPPSFSAPCPGPAARCPLRRSAEIRRSGARPRPRGGAATRPGPSPSLTAPRGSCFLLLKGPGRKGKRLVQRLPGLLGRPERGCGGQISSVSWAISRALRAALR